ncbi:Piso0_000479 [Millerozyma farinosa CBS 7064]|uniref:Piso0_000479 protein n=1 Tax=Pichia sorbitophila (strain ATCC MYA-4447 / BCRC 22081 / CBS 7064 / NBRC 10061 / NRRL Y-12695) TaxID=559304 RepID=G8YVJ4_PICSO|nr:Piso0_000479 [Millerozyma farinosa CBS 7064]CCE73438.1 Piso0_000479 [Millerozyma farinosa CBS 7064]
MDFEEQLERAESSPAPSLVGSSIRSADDSPHNNYIHPEKSNNVYDGKRSKSGDRRSALNQSITASLDDLMSEGALLGSEDNFERFLDDKGNIKAQAKYEKSLERARAKAPEPSSQEPSSQGPRPLDEDREGEKLEKVAAGEPSAEHIEVKSHDESGVLDQDQGAAAPTVPQEAGGLYQQSDYSNPNLSEYQLEKQVSSIDDFLQNVRSHDPSKLPTSNYGYSMPSAAVSARVGARKTSGERNADAAADDADDAANIQGLGQGLHEPYFHRESRSRSRTSPSRGERSRSRTTDKPHLARGDSYKNTNSDSPSNYELPPGFESEIKEEAGENDGEQERTTRESKPTMGESIAAAEAKKSFFQPEESIGRDPSLVTTGDYTNFDVDSPHSTSNPHLYSQRSESSTNYLRSISRSSSRKPADQRHVAALNEKNDANPDELAREGALITDDPYSTIGGLGTMVEEVLNIDDEGKPVQPSDKDAKVEGGPAAQTAISKSEDSSKPEAEDAVKEPQETSETSEKSAVTSSNADAEEATKVTEDSSTDVPEPKPEEQEESEVKPVDGAEKSAEETTVDEATPLQEEEVQPAGDVQKDTEADTSKEVATEEPGAAPDAKEVPSKESVSEEPSATARVEADAPKELATEEKPDAVADGASEEPKGIKEAAIPEPQGTPKAVSTAPDESDDIDVSPEELKKYLESQPIYIFTSLAGGMQIMPRTNRLVTILQANGIKFSYKDLGTDEEAKKIWKRQANGRTIPGVVRGDDLIGNWQEIDEINEEYRLKEVLYESL